MNAFQNVHDEVIRCVRERFVNKGYNVEVKLRGQGRGADVVAKKEDEVFIIEAIGEAGASRNQPHQDIEIALGKLISRMEKLESDTIINYGIAIPNSRLRFLSSFGVEGLEKLEIHLFVVNVGPLKLVSYLPPQKMVELIHKVRAGDESGQLILLYEDYFIV